MRQKEYTKKELANIAGYSYQQLYMLDRDLPTDKKLFVQVEGGTKYSLPLFVQRWVELNVARAGYGKEDLEVVKARHEAIKTQKTELEVERLRGQLIAVQDVRRLWGDIVNTVKNNLLHLPNKVAPMVRMMESTELIANIMSEEIRRILENLADTPLPDYAVDISDKEEEDEGD